MLKRYEGSAGRPALPAPGMMDVCCWTTGFRVSRGVRVSQVKEDGSGRGGEREREERTVEATPCPAGVKPAVGATAAHLAVDNDAAHPRAVALVAVLAGDTGGLAGDVREQSLDVAPPREIENLLRTPLLRVAMAGFARQPLRQRALDVEPLVARFDGQLLRGLDERRV